MSQNNFEELLKKAIEAKKSAVAEKSTSEISIADAIIITSACGYMLSMIVGSCSGNSQTTELSVSKI